MRLYHSSNMIVDKPDTSHSRNYLDFGRGFYLTSIYEQAEKYALRFKRRGQQAWLNTYELSDDVAQWNVKRFDAYDKEWLDFVKDEYAHHIKLKEGAGEFLRQASEAGIRLGAATALDEGNALSALRNNRILDYFGKVYTLTEHENEPGMSSNKTEPEFYLAAIKACGIEDDPSRIIVFDDVPDALRAAKEAGFAVCGVYDKVGTGSMSGLDFCDYSILSFPIS